MRPIRNRVRFLTKFQIVSVLLKIAPYHMQNLVDAENLRIFAPAIEGTAYCAENRSSMKTRNRGTERGAFRVVVIQRTLKHRTEYEVYEEGNLENGDFISGHFRSWSFSVIFIVYYFFRSFPL